MLIKGIPGQKQWRKRKTQLVELEQKNWDPQIACLKKREKDRERQNESEMLISLLECASSKDMAHIKLNKMQLLTIKVENIIQVIKIFSNYNDVNVKYLFRKYVMY